jgi:hypothetical protein
MRYRFLMDLFGLGLNRKQFQTRFGLPIGLGLPFELLYFMLNGALDFSNPDNIKLTRKGEYLFVVMMREFFMGINRVRDQARATLNAEDGVKQPPCIPEQGC